MERAWEQTKKFGLRLKPPKTKRGFRTIELDDGTINILLAERRSYQRFQAGIPDGAEVDLSLVRLPAKALMFPGVIEAGAEFDFTAPRNPRNFSKEFARRADLKPIRRRYGSCQYGSEDQAARSSVTWTGRQFHGKSSAMVAKVGLRSR